VNLVIGSLVADLLRPWRSSSTWWALAHVSLDMLVGGVMFAVALPLAVLSVSLIVVLPGAILASWLLFLCAHGLAKVERTRFAALLDAPIVDRYPTLSGDTPWKRYKERLGSWPRWKEVIYVLVRYPLGALTTWIAVGGWAASIALVAMPLIVSSLPGETFRLVTFEVGEGASPWLLSVLGVLGIVVIAPWLTLAVAEFDKLLARGLLGRSERREFEQRVSALESSRTAAVNSAEAERRRIERDLHDGAQQRLIAVAMNLGIARQRLDDNPEQARELVGTAHDEVKSALKELRDLVRGIHPVILEDRGLDAALSAVVARSSVPVALRVDVGLRPPPAVESAAYFIVSEALVNVVRHSGARSASVEIARRGDRLTIAVADDGIGGADPAGGTGLSGLAHRVAALDGWMQVVSPPGGPTTVLVEVPCGS